MKYPIVLLLAITASFASQAQTGHPSKAEGRPFWISGGLGFHGYTNGEFKNRNFQFFPSAGYMLDEHWGVGLALLYMNNVSENPTALGISTTTTGNFVIGPMARYYGGIGDNFSWYGQFIAAIGSSTAKTEPPIGEGVSQNYSSAMLSLSPGLQYWFTPSWSMNAEVGALSYSNNGDNSNTFELGLDLTSMIFGLNYHF